MRKTGKTPSAKDTFLWRMCHALDTKPEELAKELGISYKEVEPLLSLRRVPEVDRDEVWWKLSEHVSKRIGMLMAVKLELDKALQKTRDIRVSRKERFDKYHS